MVIYSNTLQMFGQFFKVRTGNAVKIFDTCGRFICQS